MNDDTKTATGNDYRDTLFLPKTEFPMRGGLPKAEPKWIARWDEMRLYDRMREDAKKRGAKPFILHDGPPYANGPIHLGTAMNKILKDLVVRGHQMLGYDASYIPGWDCHGLPIEWKVEEEFRAKGRTKDDVPGDEFRRACRAYAEKWIEVQKQGFRRCGVEGDWDHPYLTMNYESEAATVREFLRVAMSGRLVRGSKPIMWSPVERTALAEAEVEYHDRKVPVIWVKFPVQGEDFSVVIWTTTPWTIPANQAVSFNPSISYGLYEVESVMNEEELGFAPFAKPGDKYVLADALAQSVMDSAKVSGFKRLQDVNPEGWTLTHPLHTLSDFYKHPIPMLAGDHVTDDAGTGFVHTAPAHGEDDFLVWIASGHKASDIRDIVNEDGVYEHPDLPDALQGLDIIRTSGKKRGEQGKANPEVMRLLTEAGNLLSRGVTTIRDAHSWRSKAPVIRRATPQWFISMDKPGANGAAPLRELALKALEDTGFTPPSGRNRITSMVADRPDWLISRQRNWGVPITLLVSPDGQPHTYALPEDKANEVNKRILDAIAAEGVEAWFSADAATFLDGIADPAGWEKVTDVLDVWFDSGTTHAFTLRDRGIIDENSGQADVYLEGSDQHRGWFQSSLLECCATRGMAPYKQVVTHGFIVDSEGKKMSKSLGNTVEPEQVANQFGIEILRLWTASSDFTEDLRISDDILKTNAESYRRLRNTLRYLLGALDGYSEAEAVDPADMPGLERWVLHRLAESDALVRKSYETFDYKRIMSAMLNFCGVDLSAIYFDIRKDSLYCDAPSDNRRKAARTVMSLVLERLVTWLAPIMPFTTEEAFLMSQFAGRADSVHLLTFPDTPKSWLDAAHAARWEKIFKVRRVVTGALEVERREKRIGASLEASPEVYIEDKTLIDAFEGESPADLFITSGAKLVHGEGPADAYRLEDTPGVAVVPAKASGVKCARSWKYFDPATADPEFPDITPRDAAAVRELRGAA
ncbi:isoleucine--tRNA ligase [Henriciella mobilis]|uniref:isoleucine--tRNA ligase n=1 Tax=Henriciella mobilis TaxID=2305467 RepID=UPI000E670580|nr:isoleucine--tRNA ligase [Henriciella mobilis]RIJ16049.1 isoleucine--tRNA ligase [Henriciella mobilis]RIJ23040.1 isoleucine--tRNA ligase [Henriciella mobilis]